jgi:hypothetical protein
VTVEKMRCGFTVNGVICEYAEVWFNGALMESACCESEDYAVMAKVVAALGLSFRERELPQGSQASRRHGLAGALRRVCSARSASSRRA